MTYVHQYIVENVLHKSISHQVTNVLYKLTSGYHRNYSSDIVP